MCILLRRYPLWVFPRVFLGEFAETEKCSALLLQFSREFHYAWRGPYRRGRIGLAAGDPPVTAGDGGTAWASVQRCGLWCSRCRRGAAARSRTSRYVRRALIGSETPAVTIGCRAGGDPQSRYRLTIDLLPETEGGIRLAVARTDASMCASRTMSSMPCRRCRADLCKWLMARRMMV
jgi:hypothetical protein